jgi:chaperonin GroES
MRPIGERVIVKREEISNVTDSGIVTSTGQQELSDRAEVIAVGSGKKLNDGTTLALSVKVGDNVIINRYAGQEVIIEEESHILLNEADIFAVID